MSEKSGNPGSGDVEEKCEKMFGSRDTSKLGDFEKSERAKIESRELKLRYLKSFSGIKAANSDACNGQKVERLVADPHFDVFFQSSTHFRSLETNHRGQKKGEKNQNHPPIRLFKQRTTFLTEIDLKSCSCMIIIQCSDASISMQLQASKLGEQLKYLEWRGIQILLLMFYISLSLCKIANFFLQRKLLDTFAHQILDRLLSSREWCQFTMKISYGATIT